MPDPTALRALVKIRDRRGRHWLLPIVADAVARPSGHGAEPVDLGSLAEQGPLTIEEFKVVEE